MHLETVRHRFVSTKLCVSLFALFAILAGGAFTLGHAAPGAAPNFADTELEWKQIVGIVAPGNIVGKGTGAATGGGAPWNATSGHAEVNLTTGDLRFDVEGLVLAGGNSIGTPDGVTSVKGTLVCDTTNATNSTIVDSALVTLDAFGNAKFKGNLGALPAACSLPNIAFLIRTSGGAWLASGMVRSTDNDNDNDHGYDRR